MNKEDASIWGLVIGSIAAKIFLFTMVLVIALWGVFIFEHWQRPADLAPIDPLPFREPIR